MRADLSSLRTERHANADLARALRDGVTQHAVSSDRRQEQRDAGKNSGEQRRRATRDEALRDACIHRADVIERELRMRGANQLAQRLSERFRTLARARDDENTGTVAIGVRQVNRPLPLRFRELRLFYRADNADDGEEFCLLSSLLPL